MRRLTTLFPSEFLEEHAEELGVVETVCSGLVQSGIDPVAAGVGGETLVVVVDDGDGPDALRVIEDALDGVPGVVG